MAWEAEQGSQWQTVFDEYSSWSSPHKDPTFNTIGWNSSYTGQPIPEAEMREWVDLPSSGFFPCTHTGAGDRLWDRFVAVPPCPPLHPGLGHRLFPSGAALCPATVDTTRAGVAPGCSVHRMADDLKVSRRRASTR